MSRVKKKLTSRYVRVLGKICVMCGHGVGAKYLPISLPYYPYNTYTKKTRSGTDKGVIWYGRYLAHPAPWAYISHILTINSEYGPYSVNTRPILWAIYSDSSLR